MSLIIYCDCGRKLNVEKRHLGKKVRCPGCNTLFVAAPPDEDEPEPGEGLAPDRIEEDRPRKPRRRARREDEEAEPPRPPPRSNFWPLLALALANRGSVSGLLLLGIVSFALAFYGAKDFQLSETASATPQTLSVAHLIRNGPGDNGHVILTDFVPTDNYVVSVRVTSSEKLTGNTKGKPWENVYIPLVPRTPDMGFRPGVGQSDLRPTAIHVLLCPSRVRNEQDLARIQNANRVQGTIVNSIRSLEPKVQELLRQSYPGTDFDRCYIVQEGRAPASSTGSGAILFVGGVGVALAAGLLFLGLVARMLS